MHRGSQGCVLCKGSRCAVYTVAKGHLVILLAGWLTSTLQMDIDVLEDDAHKRASKMKSGSSESGTKFALSTNSEHKNIGSSSSSTLLSIHLPCWIRSSLALGFITLCILYLFLSDSTVPPTNQQLKLRKRLPLQQPQTPPHRKPTAFTGPPVETLRVRGSVLFQESALTEGPLGFRTKQKPPLGKEWDSVEAYFPVQLTPSDTPRWVVGWSPVVKQHKCPGDNGTTVELVHHMNIIDHPYDSEERSRFVASYDRGATSYHFPTTVAGENVHYLYGIPLGEEQLYLEYHLLKPHCWDWKIATPVIEDSGIDLYLTTTPPLISNAAIVGFMDQEFKILPKRGYADETAKATTKDLSKIFGSPSTGTHTEMGKDGWPSNVSSIKLVAIHLHTHSIFQKKFLRILDAQGNIKFQSTGEKTGYGKTEQSMSNIHDKIQEGWPATILIQKGDQLELHCRIDTNQIQQPILDGTSWGFEMCAALFIVAGDDVGFGPSQLSTTYCPDNNNDCDRYQGTTYHLNKTT